MTKEEIVKNIVNILDGKKAVDIEAIAIGDLTIIADYFIIASGTSSTHVKALADEVEYAMSQKGVEPDHIEGKSTQWILLDYGTVVVHIFYGAAREFYGLERLWTDGKKLDVAKLLDKQEGQN